MNKKLIHLFAIVLLPYVAASLSHGKLIAYWPFDEGVGTVAEDVVGGFDAQISGGTWYSPGKVGASAYTGTGGEEVNCGPGPSPTTDDLTLAWWMIDNHQSYGTIMDKSVTGSGYGYNILVRPRAEDSPLRFRIGGWQSYGGWGAECRLPNGAYNDGEWVHIVCTYDSATDTASIYVNAKLIKNGNYNPKTGIAGPGGYCDGVNNVDTPLYIHGGEETFNGVLDEVAIFDHALTPEEVQTVYKQGPLALDAAKSFPLWIAASGSDLTFTWESQAGMRYNLRGGTDLAVDLANWPVVEGDIQATPPTNTQVIARGADPARFFFAEEFPAPPVIVFSENFDGVTAPALPAGWTTGANTPPDTGTTEWELGNPAGGALTGPAAASSPDNCVGTNIAADYGIYTDIWLRTPPIDLTAHGAGTLSFRQFRNIENLPPIDQDFGSIRILAADDLTPLATLETAVEGSDTEWVDYAKDLPAPAFAEPVILEFRFEADEEENLAGWYIDDLVVSVPGT